MHLYKLLIKQYAKCIPHVEKKTDNNQSDLLDSSPSSSWKKKSNLKLILKSNERCIKKIGYGK